MGSPHGCALKSLIGGITIAQQQCLQVGLGLLYLLFKYQNLNSHLLPLLISYRSYKWGEVDKISSKFILCDHVRNSHDHSVLQSIDITSRNLNLIMTLTA